MAFFYCALAFQNIAHAQDIPSNNPLLYAGFAFSGNYENRQLLYPFSAEISKETPDLFDDILREKLNSRQQLSNRISLQKSDGKSDETSLACALVEESFEYQKIDGKIWVILIIQANVLAFNHISRSIVASYPLRMRFTHVRDSMPTQSDLKAIVLEAYTSKVPKENILDQWVNKFEISKIKSGATKYLRVVDIPITAEAEKIILQSGIKLSAIKNQVANFIEAAIADKSGVPVVPNTIGEAIGNKMLLRFASAKELNLILPEPDYAVTFTIRDFVSKKIENNTSFSDIYRAKASISIRLPDTNHVYLDENIYNTLIVTRPKQLEVQLTDWNQYFKTLQSLITSLGEQLVNVNDDWLKEHASRLTEAKPAFLQAKQLLQELK